MFPSQHHGVWVSPLPTTWLMGGYGVAGHLILPELYVYLYVFLHTDQLTGVTGEFGKNFITTFNAGGWMC